MGGQDQFGDAHCALRQAPEPDQANDLTRSATDLNEYFGALTVAATTENTVLEELVRANAALTTTNAKFLASVASIINDNEQLSC